MRLAVVCVGIVAMLATSGCSGSDPKPDPVVTVRVTESASPTPTATPTPTVSPTLSAPAQNDTPTAAPGVPVLTSAIATVSLASIDANTGGLFVGGYVVGVFEDGGSCTFTVTPVGGGAPLTVQTTGRINVDTTSCGSSLISADSLQPGNYTVTLTYQNDKGRTKSAPAAVEVN